MQWSPEAEEAIRKVPFFVRKRVRARVESEALQDGKTVISLADVMATQKRYLSGMASEIKGYQLDTCFGPSGCPHRIQLPGPPLAERLEKLLQAENLLGFLKSKGIGDLKFHHEFRITLADCPNACSQPQIKDIGIIAALLPGKSPADCSACEACVGTCREDALRIDPSVPAPVIDVQRCVACGQCIAVCPTGTMIESVKGYRIQLGGKLGRHPQLAHELPGLYDADTVLDIVAACLNLYKIKNRHGERFGVLLAQADLTRMADTFISRALK
ncbi:MAG: sulfite reductase [Desulfatitalea sp. BRH_c12]|nr:MAG: sulfite reductase [Desulfatitalea sp. BRH_c12]